MIFRRTKGGISHNCQKLWKNSEGGPLKFAWKMQTLVGGSQKSSNVIRGDHFSEVTFKGGIG